MAMMKTLTAREAKNTFGKALDLSQREPVIITKRGRPVSVMLSVEDMQALADDQEKLSPEIIEGIKRGLADANAGRVTRVDTSNRADFVRNIVAGLKHNQQ